MSNKKTALYRHFDINDNLLYVGIALKPLSRLEAHKSSSSWIEDVANIKVKWFENRVTALIEEELAIKTESPKYNIAHNSGNSRNSITPYVVGDIVIAIVDIKDIVVVNGDWTNAKYKVLAKAKDKLIIVPNHNFGCIKNYFIVKKQGKNRTTREEFGVTSSQIMRGLL